MRYLITFKDPDAVVQIDGRQGEFSYSIIDLPKKASDWFNAGEYVTLEWDSITKQIQVIYPEKEQTRHRVFKPLSVYRKNIKTSSWDYKTYQVSIYSDGTHTCECPSWFFNNSRSSEKCKHIQTILDNDPYAGGHLWEMLEYDDREEFKNAQTRLYDTRPKNSDG